MKKQPKITTKMQKVAADVLSYFFYARDMDEVIKNFKEVMDKYDLCEDPFTGFPCTPEEFYKNSLERDRQIMMDRYGHCDGLD